MKTTLLTLIAFAITLTSFGQAPEGFKYQAVVRDAGNLILNNQAVGMRMTIQQGSIGGATVYTETFAPTTNGYGLVNLEIGSGTVVSGDFTTIDWANGPYFIETAADVTGGTSYTVMGTSQLMSVPYALYAKTSGNGAGPIGAQGPAGADGTNGTNGTDGATGLTGPAGTQGPQGPAGNDGLTGAQGIQGLQGTNGAQGIQGNDGAVGATGPQGPAGPQGVPGNDGNDGATGPQGIQGNDGADGIDGATGAIGATGPQGAAGTNGTDGVDGNDGATGPQGIQGNDGADGIDGATGLQGLTGATGPAGLQGTTGAIGATGLTGPAGTNGTDGVDGIDGAQGIQGNNGIVDYDSLATIIGNDSTFTANVIGSLGSGGCELKYPDGLDGESITHEISDDNQIVYPYTVPQGKTLYIMSAYSKGSISITDDLNTVRVVLQKIQESGYSEGRMSLINPIIVSEGKTISGFNNSGNSTAINGMLIDKGVDLIFHYGTYVVPSGKSLVITYLSGTFLVNGIKMATGVSSYYVIGQPIIVGENQTVSGGLINGYLVDEDYFANCGAGQNNEPQTLSVSSTGDTLYLQNGGFVIIPGISATNAPVQLATLTTSAVSSLTNISATSGGNITDDGGANITTRGVCYSINTNPTTADNITNDGNGTGSFTSNLSGLTDGTTYYVRAYATNSAGTAYGNELSFTAALAIGDSYQGGIIFYLDGLGGGLIAAPADQSAGAPWGCYGTLITGADATAIGTGAQNTIDIEAGCTTIGTAADICENLVLAGYTDWFLPSTDELNLMYQNIGQGNALGLGNVGGFANNAYWSSTEQGDATAWRKIFITGGMNWGAKNYTYPVRAVRAF
ncbi:DUF1566 domain-containing protein [Crocinitomicaceae bacterium]|nr:DUF1566 domain-containing protein [Crocinitomicaceae bacterium]